MDRNAVMLYDTSSLMQSLSARRAWIEIQHMSHDFPAPKVALRKESVDRNLLPPVLISLKIVALRKESVDRNIFLTLTVRNVLSRSPQGERG